MVMAKAESFKLISRKKVPALETHEAWALLALFILEIIVLKF